MIDTFVLRQPGYHSAGKHLRSYGFASLLFNRFALSADNSIVIYNITNFFERKLQRHFLFIID